MNAADHLQDLERRTARSRTAQIGLALLALTVLLGATFHAGDRHRAEVDRIALAGREYHVADSVSRSLAPKIAHVDTLVVHDTIKVRVAIEHVATLRDTVLSHMTDTVLVKQYVARTDTALKACSELSNDCAQFRAFAFQRFAADSTKFTAFRASIPPQPRFGFKAGAAAATALILTVLHFAR